MFNLGRAITYCRNILLAGLIILCPLFFLSFMTVYLSRPPSIQLEPEALFLGLGLPVVLGMLPGLAALLIAWEIAGRFMHALYRLDNKGEARGLLKTRLLGQLSGGPYLAIKEGKALVRKTSSVLKMGGPGTLIIYNDSAVVLERAGRLTKVRRGPYLQRLEPFEKVWDIIDLRPQRWKFPVSAITQDGIPITYDADVGFRVGASDEEVFKAATCKWIREAWRTEPDRLMIWTKRVIIGETEGSLRSILARYTLDQLIEPASREAVRNDLEKKLNESAPGLGVEILRVALGDIKLEGQVVQQWIETWRAERVRTMRTTIAEGQAQGAKLAADARAEVRTRMLAAAAGIFAEIGKRDRKISKDFIILSFIEMIKRTSFERSIYLPDNIMKTLSMLEDQCEEKQSPLLIPGKS